MMSPEIEREMIRRHRNGTIRFDHEGEFWRDDEKRTVKMMFEEGYGISEIAFAVGRSEPAVMQQIEKMDLYQRTLNPKRHKSPPKAPTCLCDSCSLDLSACPRCEALRMGYNAMYDLLNSGKLKGFRNGRVWRIPKLAIKEYILESARIKVKEERVR